MQTSLICDCLHRKKHSYAQFGFSIPSLTTSTNVSLEKSTISSMIKPLTLNNKSKFISSLPNAFAIFQLSSVSLFDPTGNIRVNKKDNSIINIRDCGIYEVHFHCNLSLPGLTEENGYILVLNLNGQAIDEAQFFDVLVPSPTIEPFSNAQITILLNIPANSELRLQCISAGVTFVVPISDFYVYKISNC